QPDKSLTLPRNHMEGDIPNIAISTGAADTLECLLTPIACDPAAYVPGPGGEGRVHIFQGTPREGPGGGGGLFGGGMDTPMIAPNTSPAAPASPDGLWNTLENLMVYDIVLLSCEGQETPRMQQQAMH